MAAGRALAMHEARPDPKKKEEAPPNPDEPKGRRR
jgi:hypothetical protein